MLNGECIKSNTTECMDCHEQLEIQVCESAAGYYIGFFCPNCGPYSRESGYFKHKDAAEMTLMTGNWKGRWE